MSQHVMADPPILGAQYHLGNHKATYQPRILMRQDIAVSIALGIGLSVMYAMLIFVAMPFVAMPFINKIIGSIIVAFIVLLFFSAMSWEIYRKQVLRVFTYDYGLIHIGRKSSPTIIYWQKVQSVIHKVKVVGDENYSETRHVYTLNCTDGTSLRLEEGTFPEFFQLMASIEVETARYLSR
jgi:hypothetical protein